MSPDSLNPENRRAYRRRARPFVFLGVLCLGAGLGGLLRPNELEQSLIAAELAVTVRTIWLCLYALGGAMTIAGAASARPEWEGRGEWLLIGGFAIQAIVTMTLRNPIAAALPLLFIFFASWTVWGRITDLHNAANVERRHYDVPYPGAEKRS